MGYKVFINAGHGGNDSGAVGIGGLKEKDLNLTIALACEAELKRHGVDVIMHRSTDKGSTSSQVSAACNKYAPSMAVDIHCNAGGGDGAEVFHHYKGGTGKTLAVNILNEISAIGQNSRGAKTRVNSAGKDYYYFIREISCPSVIVECAFLDNKNDVQIIDTAAEQKAFGVCIAKGILKTLGVSYIVAYDPVQKSVDEIAREVIQGKWGNGSERKEKLTAAGYDYIAIQKRVNELLK